jgi:MarR family transcriptional regulator, organic hydroperoxide resistance regulator
VASSNSNLKERISSLRFGGSVWCNLDIALRNVDQLFTRAAQDNNLSVIEWYVLRALYDQDGQHASELARSVGRAATSFTPNLDKLQDKALIERQPDPSDRRAVRIFLTKEAKDRREEILGAAEELDGQIRELFGEEDFTSFLRVLATLQSINLD